MGDLLPMLSEVIQIEFEEEVRQRATYKFGHSVPKLEKQCR